MPAGEDRLAGYHDALETAGFARDAKLVSDGDFTQQGGAELRGGSSPRARISMRSSPRPT